MPTDLTAFIAAGPAGFLALAAFFAYWAASQWRKARLVDVNEAREAAAEEKSRADTLQEELSKERDRRLQEGTEYRADQEGRVRRESLYRRALIEAGKDPDEVVRA